MADRYNRVIKYASAELGLVLVRKLFVHEEESDSHLYYVLLFIWAIRQAGDRKGHEIHFYPTPLAAILRNELSMDQGLTDVPVESPLGCRFTMGSCTIYTTISASSTPTDRVVLMLEENVEYCFESISELCIKDDVAWMKIMFDMKRFHYLMCAELFQQHQNGGKKKTVAGWNGKWEFTDFK